MDIDKPLDEIIAAKPRGKRGAGRQRSSASRPAAAEGAHCRRQQDHHQQPAGRRHRGCRPGSDAVDRRPGALGADVVHVDRQVDRRRHRALQEQGRRQQGPLCLSQQDDRQPLVSCPPLLTNHRHPHDVEPCAARVVEVCRLIARAHRSQSSGGPGDTQRGSRQPTEEAGQRQRESGAKRSTAPGQRLRPRACPVDRCPAPWTTVPRDLAAMCARRWRGRQAPVLESLRDESADWSLRPSVPSGLRVGRTVARAPAANRAARPSRARRIRPVHYGWPWRAMGRTSVRARSAVASKDATATVDPAATRSVSIRLQAQRALTPIILLSPRQTLDPPHARPHASSTTSTASPFPLAPPAASPTLLPAKQSAR